MSITTKLNNTNIVLHDDGSTIVSTRICGTSIHRIISSCNGTTVDYINKVERVSQLCEEVFITFSNLQKLDNLGGTNENCDH